MDTMTGLVLVLAPTLLVTEAAVGIATWWRRPGVLHKFAGSGLFRWRPLGIGALAAAWMLLTVTSWWCLFLYGYVAINLLYFGLGVAGGWIALIGAGALAIGIPVVWGALLLGLARRDFGRPAPKAPAPVVARLKARVRAAP